MGTRYTSEAVNHCLSLYLQFNGGEYERIEKEMRKEWPHWSRNNLFNKGKGKKLRKGWIDMYGWDRALALKVATSGESAATSAELLFLEIESQRRRLKREIDALGAKADKDLVYQHRDYCKLSIDALARLEKARDNLAGFVKCWNNLMEWLPAISDRALRELLKVSDMVIEKARTEYANTSEE